MKFLITTIVLLFIVVLINAAENASSDVLVLTDKTFSQEMNGLVLVEFYAPWCGHCKKLAPIYEELATKLKSESNPVRLAKVDCDVEKATCKRFDIGSFPTLRLVDNDKKALYEYKGDRSPDDLTKFINGGYLANKQVKLPRDKSIEVEGSFQLLNDKDFINKTSNGDWLIYYYIPTCRYCKIYAPKFEDIAADFFEKGKVNFAKINCDESPDTCELYQVTGYPSIKYIDNEKTGRIKDFYQEPTYENMEFFIQHGQAMSPGKPKPLFNNLILSLIEEAVREFIWLFISVSFIFGFSMSYIFFGMNNSSPTPKYEQQKPQQPQQQQVTEKSKETKKNK